MEQQIDSHSQNSLQYPSLVGIEAMATAHGTTPELEFPNTDNFLDNFLVFNSGKNQFKWTGSVQQLESFIFQTLNISQEHAQSKANNGTCVVWKTPNATFNFYLKTKTLQVQGKAVETIRNTLLQSLGHSFHDSAADETVFVNDAEISPGEPMPSPLISDGMFTEPARAVQDDVVPVLNGNSIDPASTELHQPFDCRKKIDEMSEELELLKQENRHSANQLQAMKEVKQSPVVTSFDYRNKLKELSEELDMLKQENCQYANLLQTANEEKQSLIASLRLLANELRTSNLHEHVDTRLVAENKSLQETINILNADNQLLTTKVAELSNQQGIQVLKDQNQDQAPDFHEVTSRKKKKKTRVPKSAKGQQSAIDMDQEHVGTQCNDTTIIIGDSIIKGLRNDLLSRATSSDMKHYLQTSLQLEPREIILHADTNDIRDSSPRTVAEKMVDLGNLVSSSSPTDQGYNLGVNTALRRGVP